MKSVILAAAAAAAFVIASGQARAQTVSGSQSGAYSQSAVVFGDSPRQAPNAIAPGLIASGLSCSGSASVGGAGAGWGLSLGITRADRNCDAREDAKILAALAGSQAALARMCQIKDNAKALADAGVACPGQVVRAAASEPQLRSSQPEVRAQPTFRVIKSGISMAECRRMAAKDPNITCRAR